MRVESSAIPTTDRPPPRVVVLKLPLLAECIWAPIHPSSGRSSPFRRTRLPSSALPRRLSLATVFRRALQISGCPANQEPYGRGDSSILHHPEQNWLYPLGRVKQGTNISALQQKLSAALRNWLSTRPAYTDHGGSSIIPKQHVTIVPGGGGIQSMQRNSPRSQDADDSFLSRAADRLRQHCKPGPGAQHYTPRRYCGSHGSGSQPFRVIRQIVTESVLLSCIGGLAGLAVAYEGSRTILALAFPDAHNLTIDASPSLAVLGFAFLVS